MNNLSIRWLCLLSRLHSICTGNSPVEKSIQAIPSFVENVNIDLKQSFDYLSSIAVFPYRCRTLSTYGDEICTYIHLNAFGNVPYNIPDFLLKQFLGANNWKIYFGYLGRTYIIDSESRYVTDGLCVNDSAAILLDLPNHLQMGWTSLAFRLVHELLHVQGYNEEHINQCQGDIVLSLIDKHEKEFALMYDEMKTYANNFYSSIHQLSTSYSSLIDNIEKLCNIAHKNGFPASSQDLLYATVYHPIFIRPEKILFF